jgi:hypothetical protein
VLVDEGAFQVAELAHLFQEDENVHRLHGQVFCLEPKFSKVRALVYFLFKILFKSAQRLGLRIWYLGHFCRQHTWQRTYWPRYAKKKWK